MTLRLISAKRDEKVRPKVCDLMRLHLRAQQKGHKPFIEATGLDRVVVPRGTTIKERAL